MEHINAPSYVYSLAHQLKIHNTYTPTILYASIRPSIPSPSDISLTKRRATGNRNKR